MQVNEGDVEHRGSKRKQGNLTIATGWEIILNAFTMSPYTMYSIATTLDPIDAIYRTPLLLMIVIKLD